MDFQKNISSDAGLVEFTRENHYLSVHPWKLTCPLKRDYFSREYIFQPLIFRGHVSFLSRCKIYAPSLHSSIWIHLFFFCIQPALKWIFLAVPFQLLRPSPKNKDFFRTRMVSQNGWFLSLLFPISGWCQTNVKTSEDVDVLPIEMCLLCVCNYFVHYRYLYTCWLMYTSIITLDQYPYVGWFFVCFGFVYDPVVPMSLRSLPDCTLVATTKVLQRTLAEHCPLPGRDPTSGGEFPWKRSLQST